MNWTVFREMATILLITATEGDRGDMKGKGLAKGIIIQPSMKKFNLINNLKINMASK